MSLIGTYEMASTFAFTPLAIAAANATIEVIDKDNLMSRALEIGTKWRSIVQGWNHPKIDYVVSIGADSNLYFKVLGGPVWLHSVCIKGYSPTRVPMFCASASP
jgi:ornithine--oxo-acid transaminase